jgi:hypothetical protein
MKLKDYGLVIISGALIILTGCAPEKEEEVIQTVPPATILVEPESSSYEIGKKATVGVRLEDVSNTFSVSFDLSYNPVVLSYESSTIGGFLVSDGPATAILLKGSKLDGIEGTVVVGITRSADNFTDGVSGSGDLCALEFTVIGAGTSELRLSNYVVQDPNGGGISVLSEDSQITGVGL